MFAYQIAHLAHASHAAAAPLASVGGGTSNPAAGIAIAAFLAVFAFVQLVNPRIMWRLRSRGLRHPEAVEPSDTGFLIMRISGGAMLCLAVFVVLLSTHVL